AKNWQPARGRVYARRRLGARQLCYPRAVGARPGRADWCRVRLRQLSALAGGPVPGCDRI
ncbi:MAG: hypothetical protein AVDCRST_MAG43-1622, partial [uncultured Thermomicrobiales bacterium]